MASTPVTTYVAGLAPPLREVAERLVEVLDAGLEGRDGVMWHGHPVWMDGKTPVAGFKAYGAYVTLMLWQGQRIDDATGRLTASGSAQMASTKIATVDDIEESSISSWLRAVDDLPAA